MTQEFVAEHLGVSRQAVSKWESGVSDPNTANLIAVAKLYGTTAEEILKEVREKMKDMFSDMSDAFFFSGAFCFRSHNADFSPPDL